MTDEETIRENSDGVLDFVGQVSDQLRSRRAFMGDAAKVGAGAAALSAVGAGTVAANDGNGDSSDGGNGDGSDDVSDIDILNYALTLEHLEAAYYNDFLDNYSESDVERSEVAKYFARPTLRYSVYQQIEDVRDHEEAHVDALTKTINDLGGTPVEPANYEFPYSSIQEFIAVADRLEAVGVSAYAGAAPLISNPDIIPPALSIHSVEANHQTYFQLLNLQRPAPNAFNPARSMDEVLGIAKQFIVSEEDAPEMASATFEDQSSDGSSVTVASAALPDGGFVAIHDSSLLDGNVAGSVIGVSEAYDAGTQMDVEIPLYSGVPGGDFDQSSLDGDQTLIAMPHLDTNGNGSYDFITSGGEEDGAYTADGEAVVDDAEITVE
ncbi:ferritin-like domain-containing protein [Halococcus sediminicola]|uniref:ferritin-like domain-containing protein n=1 Tax=Halococcus sediminicola TaxID=1264579 RepID=UPI00067867CA|nr:ferritin-like domain-containing protein [Halococcus sediminicola]